MTWSLDRGLSFVSLRVIAGRTGVTSRRRILTHSPRPTASAGITVASLGDGGKNQSSVSFFSVRACATSGLAS